MHIVQSVFFVRCTTLHAQQVAAAGLGNFSGTAIGSRINMPKPESLIEARMDDPAKWSCTVRCLVGATSKPDALACADKCGTGPLGDAGVEAGADAGVPTYKPPPPEIE